MPGKSRPSSHDAGASAPSDLVEQRDDFIHTFFKKGAELTSELLAEDERLRARLREVDAENAALRAQVASDDASRALLATIDALERDKRDLFLRLRDAQADQARYATRFADIEAENAKLASLYVASYQLHSALDSKAVLRHLRELLAQFVGAAAFAIYLSDDARDELVPVVVEGVAPRAIGRVQRDDGPLGTVFATGWAQWTGDDATLGTVDAPAAMIPLRFDDRTVGLIAVFTTFEQKPAFVELDFELFQLLGAHAASALAAARLFDEHGATLGAIDSFPSEVAR